MTNQKCKTLGAALAALLLSASSTFAGTDPGWQKFSLSDKFYSEGSTYGDFNKDGTLDFAAGPFWYEGPDFSKKHTIYEGQPFDGSKGYSRNFFAFPGDFNNDGYADVFVVGFPSEESVWFENPQGKDEPWKRHVALKSTDNESPRWGDIDGDGKMELICSTGGLLGWAAPGADPTAEWTFHKITHTPDKRFHKFTHGLGYGDVNGDGKIDLLEAQGWWEQPAKLDDTTDWKFHAQKFGDGGAQMFTYDVDGDGDADVITSDHAHGYGLLWFEQKKDGDKVTFERHEILSSDPKVKIDGVQFSQLHAVSLVDMNGDGLKDIVTGKRRWAHGDHGDPDPNGAPVIYWFELKREDGKVKYIPHLIDDDSGVGTQVTVIDMNGDGKPDVLVGNKRGQFVLIQKPDVNK